MVILLAPQILGAKVYRDAVAIEVPPSSCQKSVAIRGVQQPVPRKGISS